MDNVFTQYKDSREAQLMNKRGSYRRINRLKQEENERFIPLGQPKKWYVS